MVYKLNQCLLSDNTIERNVQNYHEQEKMATSLIQRKDYLLMSTLTRRLIAAALDACTAPKLLKTLKRRVILVKPTATFQSFVEAQKFGPLKKVLNNERCNFHTWLPDSATLPNGESALHLILKYNPPVEIVELLLQRMKEMHPGTNPVTYQDEYGMTPLHVAVGRSCDARIIELFVFGQGGCAKTNVAGIADCHHRFPLHYICTIPSRIQKNGSGKRASSIFNDTVRIIRCLVVSFPDAIHSPDKNGWTAHQMAKSLVADDDILEILESTICRTHLEKQTSITTPTTLSETTEELGLPFDEIIVDHSDNEDDVSSIGIGWNTHRKTATSSTDPSKRTEQDEIKAQIDILTLSIHEIKIDRSHFQRSCSQKYRYFM